MKQCPPVIRNKRLASRLQGLSGESEVTPMRFFHFYRVQDLSGVSGTGPVAEGVEFTNGWCALRWLTGTSSFCFYQSLEDVKAIHGHGGNTEIIIHDFSAVQRPRTHESEVRLDRFLDLIEEVARVSYMAEDVTTTPEELRNGLLRVRLVLDELEHGLGLSSETAAS